MSDLRWARFVEDVVSMCLAFTHSLKYMIVSSPMNMPASRATHLIDLQYVLQDIHVRHLVKRQKYCL